MKKLWIFFSPILILSSMLANAAQLSPIEQLGKSIFFDRHLSINKNQSCAACHAPQSGWTGPKSEFNETGSVYEGSIETRFGNRKPPSSAYATPSPILHFVVESNEALFIGGNFWDGRATGERLGSPAAEQALGPFLNPVEQALPDNACVVYRACNPEETDHYPVSFNDVWGAEACNINWPPNIDDVCSTEGGMVNLSAADRDKVKVVYDKIGLTVAAYEASSEVNQYSSKFDYYLAGKVRLSGREMMGLRLFRGRAKCANCHVLDAGPNGEPPLLTDFTFDNLGIPKNPENPWYTMPPEFNPDGANWIDKGLGGFLSTRLDYAQFAPANYGKHKVPTLRNVDKRPGRKFVKAYGHNGYFKSLKGIVHFYNTRDVKPTCPDPLTTEADALLLGCWPAPEVSANVNTSEMGNLRLSNMQENAIVAFLETLSDGFNIDNNGGNHH